MTALFLESAPVTDNDMDWIRVELVASWPRDSRSGAGV
jgi:hypothetical protein